MNSNKRWAAEVPKGREAAELVAKEAGCSLDKGEIIPGTLTSHQGCLFFQNLEIKLHHIQQFSIHIEL